MKRIESYDDFLNEANIGSTTKELGDLMALLNDMDNSDAIISSIKELDAKKLNTLEKQISALSKALFKLA